MCVSGSAIVFACGDCVVRTRGTGSSAQCAHRPHMPPRRASGTNSIVGSSCPRAGLEALYSVTREPSVSEIEPNHVSRGFDALFFCGASWTAGERS